jgi:hypothetical protein
MHSDQPKRGGAANAERHGRSNCISTVGALRGWRQRAFEAARARSSERCGDDGRERVGHNGGAKDGWRRADASLSGKDKGEQCDDSRRRACVESEDGPLASRLGERIALMPKAKETEHHVLLQQHTSQS